MEWLPIDQAPSFETVLLYAEKLAFGSGERFIAGIKSEHPSGDIWVSCIGAVKPTHFAYLTIPKE